VALMAMQRLWARKMKDGSEIAATLFHDRALGEATAEISVRSAHAEGDLAIRLADGVRCVLDQQGAMPIVQVKT
jgi:hypothetical protein